jgi:hypothetical protein
MRCDPIVAPELRIPSHSRALSCKVIALPADESDEFLIEYRLSDRTVQAAIPAENMVA